MADTAFDIIIIGAGLSGVNAAYRIQTELPAKTFCLLESRDQMGGTWDFWKYPGARTDSSMGVFGFQWFPWRKRNNLAPAHEIKQYIEEAAASRGIDKRVRLRHRITSASWSSEEQRWSLDVDVTSEDGSVEKKVFKAWWLVCASGYYNYEKALPAVIPGIESFSGEVVHPQWWGDDVVHDDKRIIIIGSGATAITLLPTLAKTAKSVTMLQRSPSYVFALPGKVPVHWWDRVLPQAWSDWIRWWMNMLEETAFTGILSQYPKFGRWFVRGEMRKFLPKGFDIDTHFNPSYNVFEQRLCFCPSADFFRALHKPHVEIVTDKIETVTKTGIQLQSGRTLEADMIITATGLWAQMLSGVNVFVDGERFDTTIGQRYFWNSTMLDGLPNANAMLGYVATSWTPGADIRAKQMVKIIKHMDRTGATTAKPVLDEADRARFPKISALALTSTYALQAAERLPKSAYVGPWMSGKGWLSDAWNYLFGSITKGVEYTYGKNKSD